LATIEAYDTTINNFVTIPPGGCAFGYRTSRFKTSEKGRFYITSLTLNLVKGNPRPPFYVTLASYLEAHQITEFTPQVIRDAVIDIRYHKLPDPNIVHNVGSFFGNPIVSEYQYEQYSRDYDVVPHWSVGEGNVKLSAAWLIEQAGFKDFKDPRTGMATWANQPLVLVNENATSTASLLAFRERIVEAVKQKFNVTLTQEPELLP
jgi:UDP-N-acetylmuramate dehydrogenase